VDKGDERVSAIKEVSELWHSEAVRCELRVIWVSVVAVAAGVIRIAIKRVISHKPIRQKALSVTEGSDG